MNGDEVYGVWLQQALGEGSRRVPLLVDYFGSCKAVYEADETELRLSGQIIPKEVSMLMNTPLDTAIEITEACDRLGYSILTPDSDGYPDRLRNIWNYPAALYINGVLPDIDRELCISMVGTRNASRQGYAAALNISRELAENGVIVISGCARGIDTAAHKGTLLAGGKTVAVLGCGINERYNMENESLRKVISTSGAVISEYPPGSPPLSYHFPVRNRIISALSLGVVVIEAGPKSGSLITANYALNQGKDIFSVPGNINSVNSRGTNRLICDGAKPVESAYDILSEYTNDFPDIASPEKLSSSRADRRKKEKNVPGDKAEVFSRGGHADVGKKASPRRADRQENPPPEPRFLPADQETEPPIGMSRSAQKLWRALDATPKHFDDFLGMLQMNSSELARCITELELYGAVKSLPGNKYSKP